MDHHRPGDKISQPPIPLIKERANDADAIEPGNRVDRPQEISCHCLKRRDRPPSIFYDTNSGLPFPWSLAFPPDLEDRVVAPVKAKPKQNHPRDYPL